MKFKFSPWLCVEPDPVDSLNPEGGGGTAPSPDGSSEIEALRAELAAKEQALANSRQIERKYRSLEALVGTTNPEELQKLKEAEQRYQQQQEASQQELLKVRNEVTSEYTGQIEQLNQKVTTLQTEAEKQRTEYQLFSDFNGNDGVGNKFSTFVKLAGNYFERANSGELQVKDETGKLVIYSDKTNGDRAATPADFMKMLASGHAFEGYQFSDVESLRHTFQPYNKALGAGLPTKNGVPSAKSLDEMSQSELGKMAFG